MARQLTQKEIEALVKMYIAARERLLNTVIYYKGVGTKTYANTILRQLQRELRALEKATTEFINTGMPREYKTALRSIYSYFSNNHLAMQSPSAFAALHTDALYEISREMQYQINQGLATVGRQVTRYVQAAQDEALRSIGLEQTGIKIASGGTVQDMRNSLTEQLQDNGFMTVQYGEEDNARQVPIDVYAGMVARSTTREAGNTARLNQLVANGYDLVKMSEHYPTCEICAKFQGRVYSISGKDKRFPALSVAFGAYNNIHPNCRHIISPWIEDLHTPEEIQREIEFANRPFEDTRSSKEQALYKEQQDKHRRERNDLYQYERYKEVLGENAPKSLREFRRIKKADGENWGVLQAKYKAMGYYNRAVKIEPEITATVLDVAKKVGMEHAGLEFRVKGVDSYLRKVETNYSPNGTSYEVRDILRYTYTAPAEELTNKALQSIETYKQMGYTTSNIKNYWQPQIAPYRGINTTIAAPDGQMFELQYHTPESFAVKNGELHKLFEEYRLISDSLSPRAVKLMREMVSLSSPLSKPFGIERVK